MLLNDYEHTVVIVVTSMFEVREKILYLSRSTEITDDARDKFLGVLPTSFFSKNFSKLSTPPGPEVDFEE